MTKNALSILIVIFSVHLQQTETSGRKLFIFQHRLRGYMISMGSVTRGEGKDHNGVRKKNP